MHPSVEKLTAIRSAMKKRGTDALIIPETDPHMSEYVPDHWRIIEWVSGFTGSAGTLVITDSFAGLWTDSRYTIQAARQLEGSEIIPIIPTVSLNSITLWLNQHLDNGSVLGVDGRTISHSRLERLRHSCAGKGFVFETGFDCIAELWTGRPPVPATPAFDFPVIYAGKDRKSKIRQVRDEMQKMGADYHFLSSADDIMWLLNIRGRDIRYSPLLLSFALISMEQVLLFADEEKIPFRVAVEFDRNGVVVLPYDEAEAVLASIDDETSVLLSPSSVSESVFTAIPANMKKIEGATIPSVLKSVKNSTEAENIRKAMIRDGVALTKFFFRLESMDEPLTELQLTAMLEDLRSQQEGFISLSFSTIMAVGEHAALPHYNANEESDSALIRPCLLLVDSGSHYFEGTTDITRTVAIGTPSARQKSDFTLVLKAMIGLATAVFPEGTTGVQLDILARKFLWEKGLNYGHGTGHGVGYCLNVHEGPPRISPSAPADATNRIVPGMILSDEPAIYREGEYGIRTENLLLCYEDEETEYGKFYRFSTLSLCFIDKNLIEISLLDKEEIRWLNDYHSVVYSSLESGLLPGEREWLRFRTAPL